MSKGRKIINFLFVALLTFTITACAPAKKNTYYAKKKKSSQVDASQLGRNKYYFSPKYQKKLNKSYKKR